MATASESGWRRYDDKRQFCLGLSVQETMATSRYHRLAYFHRCACVEHRVNGREPVIEEHITSQENNRNVFPHPRLARSCSSNSAGLQTNHGSRCIIRFDFDEVGASGARRNALVNGLNGCFNTGFWKEKTLFTVRLKPHFIKSRNGCAGQ